MGVVFRYMAYDAQVVVGGRGGSGGRGRHRPPPTSSSSSSHSSSSNNSGGGDNDGSLVVAAGNINFDRTVEFVNDRWKELREKLAEATASSSSAGGTSSSTGGTSSSAKTKTATTHNRPGSSSSLKTSLPDWTDETCLQTKGGQGSWSQIKSLLYFCIYTEFLWWFQLNYHQYCQHRLVQQQQEQHGHRRRLPSQHLHTTTNNNNNPDAPSSSSSLSELIPPWMILPQLSSSLFDGEEWMVYFRRVFLRLKSAAYDYQMTVTLVGFYDAFFALVCPHSTVTKLTQQPYHRALYVSSFLSRTTASGGSSGRKTTTKTNSTTSSSSSSRQLSLTDRWGVATDSLLTCLWANLGFFLAVYTYGQYVEYRLYQQQIVRVRTQSQQSRNNSIGQTQTTPSRPRSSSSTPSSLADLVERQTQIFQQKSSKLVLETFGRYVASAVGAGVGSFAWPGYGTLVGIGVGDGLAQLHASSSAAFLLPSHPMISNMISHEYVSKAVSTFQTVRTQITKIFGDTVRTISSYRTGIESDSTIVLEEDLMCGCCQIVSFSRDPSDPNRAPVSSRECSHTICKKCVQQVHLNLVERVHIYTEWISCPICKAPNAFSSHNHLINRSLCSAIGLIERKQLRINQYKAAEQQHQHQFQQQQQQRELEAAFNPVRHFTPIKMVRSTSPTSISVNSRRSRISQSRSMR